MCIIKDQHVRARNVGRQSTWKLTSACCIRDLPRTPNPASISSCRSSGADVTTDAGVNVAAALGDPDTGGKCGRALSLKC